MCGYSLLDGWNALLLNAAQSGVHSAVANGLHFQKHGGTEWHLEKWNWMSVVKYYAANRDPNVFYVGKFQI